MSYRGVLFAITAKDLSRLRAFTDDEERREYVTEVIEEREEWGTWAIETDKAWDGIHRCFCVGLLEYDGGDYPFNHIILGGEQMVNLDDYEISLKTVEQVRDIAARIGEITQAELRRRYDRIDRESYRFEHGDEDAGYVWDWFTGVADFYRRAAAGKRPVIFTVDL